MKNRMMNVQTMSVLLAAILLVCGCTQQQAQTPKHFTTEAISPYTPIKDQGGSEACWAYAMLATIESEHIIMGDSVNLSPLYAVRTLLEQQTVRRYLTGKSSLITAKGTMPLLIDVMKESGMVCYDAYHGDCNTPVVCRKLTKKADAAMARGIGVKRLEEETAGMLDSYIGPTPENVFLFGARYSTQEFAESVCLPNEYHFYTSFSHHPFYQDVDLELPDNYRHSSFTNLPIDTLVNIIVDRLESGHPVCWEGDVTEPGFSFSKGVAVLANEAAPCSQQMRQQAFERHETTDDHCMELIGIAKDENNKRYIICKNSWGTANPYGGLMYMSLDYLRLKTIAVAMRNEK